MAEKLDPKETVSFEELLLSNVLQQEALINLLDKKGIIKKGEILEELKRVKEGLEKKLPPGPQANGN
jgi:hypothetical protein